MGINNLGRWAWELVVCVALGAACGITTGLMFRLYTMAM